MTRHFCTPDNAAEFRTALREQAPELADLAAAFFCLGMLDGLRSVQFATAPDTLRPRGAIPVIDTPTSKAKK